MEKGAINSSGFCVSDMKSPSNSSDVDLHSTDASFLSKNGVTGAGGLADIDGGDGGLGSTGGGVNEMVGNIYREGGENFVRSTNLQPFDIFTTYSNTHYSYPVRMGAFPFTSAQWKELQRQAMIYKYMAASVPVPPDLFMTNSPRNFTNSSASLSVGVGRYSKTGDLEPGRCKRTDGKKWRCSRDVAPHQKYCERHLHRGRPRSRKPVEVKDNGKTQTRTRIEQPTVQPNTVTSQRFDEPLLLFNAQTDLSISTPSYKGTNRDFGLIESEHQWQHLMETNMGFGNEVSSVYNFHESLNLLSYSNLPTQEIEPPSGFIDAWSIDNLNNSNAESPVSLNLSMAMAAGNVLDEEMGSIRVGNGVKDSVSWEPFARGGPLGEALQPGGSVYLLDGSNSSNPATTVSSPNEVFHRTLFSHSDSSVCNSPTLAQPPSEVASHWLN